MLPELPYYKAYILRLWQTERDGAPATVASLEDCQSSGPLPRPRQVFTSLEALLEFLELAVQMDREKDPQIKQPEEYVK